MERPKMKKEKKELVKKFKVVIEDLLDNYEIYTDEEKTQIKVSALVCQKQRPPFFNKRRYDFPHRVYHARFLLVFDFRHGFIARVYFYPHLWIRTERAIIFAIIPSLKTLRPSFQCNRLP